MTDNIIKSPLLPDTIHFNHTMENQTEVMRITRDGVWVNPDMAVDETAKAVLDALSSQVKVLVQRAVEDEREVIAQSLDKQADLAPDEIGRQWAQEMAAAVRARGEK